jgi:hypothetical protein
MSLRPFHPTASVRSPVPVEDTSNASLCLACGGEVAPSLSRTGSVRCHDCRDVDAPLRPDLVEPDESSEDRAAA